jgi:predicted glycosyltransferase
MFKNVITDLVEHGHIVKVVAVEKDLTTYLLRKYNIPCDVIGINQPTLIKKILVLPKWEYYTLKISHKFKPDIYIGRALPHLAHISALSGKPFIIFEDTEVAKLVHKITVPFANNIVTPLSYKENLGKKQIRFDGLFDLGYLHTKYFNPDPSVFEDLGLSKGEKYTILRFVSWNASHDIGQSGISSASKKEYLSVLEKYCKVFISSEAKLPSEFKKYELKIDPAKFHSVLSYAQLYIGEGGSTATEAAILGTPSIHISTTAKHCGVFNDLAKYNLVYTFDNDQKALEKAIEILSNPQSKEIWVHNKDLLLKEKIDVTKFMVGLIEGYFDSLPT